MRRIDSFIRVALTVVALMAVSVTTTATHAGPVQDQSEPPVTEESISVRYVTLRNRTASHKRDVLFGGGRGTLQGGVGQVTFTPIPGLSEVVKSAPFYIPDETLKLTEVREMPAEEVLDELAANAAGGQEKVVVYIHGYNIGFKKSCRRAAIFQRALNLHGRLLLFSWPAEGNLLKYTWDEADLVWSVPSLTRVLEALIHRVGPGNLNFVAHSLGARGAMQALSRIACRQPDTPLIDELVLVAPDIDRDIFAQELPILRPLVRRLTVYVSDNDKPLKLSKDVHGYPRLGDAGDLLAIFEGVDTIDISPLSQRRLSGHLYHLYNPAVINDLSKLLHEGLPAAQRPGLTGAKQNGQLFWQLRP